MGLGAKEFGRLRSRMAKLVNQLAKDKEEGKKKSTEKKAEKPAKNEKPRDVIPQKIKLSWREARELEALPEKLEAMEKEQASIINAMSAFDYHSKSVEDIKADKLRLEELEKSIADGWTRWEALSEKESLSTGK